jgi:hypothetical protein
MYSSAEWWDVELKRMDVFGGAWKINGRNKK